MKPSHDPVDLFPAAPFAHPAILAGARIMNDAYRAITSSLAMVKALSEPLRRRLQAPLVGPTRFGSAREYRIWKATRSARPQTWSPLQWPLGIWLLLGLALTLWARSALS